MPRPWSGFVSALLVLPAFLPIAAQEADSYKKFAGKWEAAFKGKVICTILIKAGDAISGRAEDCSINVDANGDLQEPESGGSPDEPSPILNPKVHGDTLSFEENEGGELVKFELRVLREGVAELKILDAPVPVKPIHFERK